MEEYNAIGSTAFSDHAPAVATFQLPSSGYGGGLFGFCGDVEEEEEGDEEDEKMRSSLGFMELLGTQDVGPTSLLDLLQLRPLPPPPQPRDFTAAVASPRAQRAESSEVSNLPATPNSSSPSSPSSETLNDEQPPRPLLPPSKNVDQHGDGLEEEGEEVEHKTKQ